jgi:hypothetical protein
MWTDYFNLILLRYGLESPSPLELRFNKVPRADHANIVLAFLALKNVVEVTKAYRAHVPVLKPQFLWVRPLIHTLKSIIQGYLPWYRRLSIFRCIETECNCSQRLFSSVSSLLIPMPLHLCHYSLVIQIFTRRFPVDGARPLYHQPTITDFAMASWMSLTSCRRGSLGTSRLHCSFEADASTLTKLCLVCSYLWL